MLKEELNDYISTHDIVVKTLNKAKLINQIFKVYKFLYKDVYLLKLCLKVEHLIVDSTMFPITDNDPKGLALADKIRIAMTKDGNENKDKITKFLNDIPMYFLLSILGEAHYHEQEKLGANSRQRSMKRKN